MCEVYDIAGYANSVASLLSLPTGHCSATYAAACARGNGRDALNDKVCVSIPTRIACPSARLVHTEAELSLADLSGHSDAVGGALCVDDDELAEKLRAQRTAIGGVPGALEVWLLLRSLRTLPLRLERHNTSARLIVAWLQQSIEDADHPLHGLVERVWHPSLLITPGTTWLFAKWHRSVWWRNGGAAQRMRSSTLQAVRRIHAQMRRNWHCSFSPD